MTPMSDKSSNINKGQIVPQSGARNIEKKGAIEDFVLNKSIFSNIFEKDIKRVYIYKKSERLAKAIHLIGPAFHGSPALRDRLDKVAVGLVDAATDVPMSARTKLSRELLALSSVLSIARTSGLLSPMNAELIAREAQNLLQEVANYQEPRLFLDDAPTLAELARDVSGQRPASSGKMSEIEHFDSLDFVAEKAPKTTVQKITFATSTTGQSINKAVTKNAPTKGQNKKTASADKGQISDKKNTRRDSIISVLKSNGPSHIKGISTIIREVSEKTIQRELQGLVESGVVSREGERRWTIYTLSK
jgi:hypothetical protein